MCKFVAKVEQRKYWAHKHVNNFFRYVTSPCEWRSQIPFADVDNFFFQKKCMSEKIFYFSLYKKRRSRNEADV